MTITQENVENLHEPADYCGPAFDPAGRDAELVRSIRGYGVLEPIMVAVDNWEILHGVRRYWAARYLRQLKTPVVLVAAPAAAQIMAHPGRGRTLYEICVREHVNIGRLCDMKDPHRRRDGFVTLEHRYGRAEGELVSGHELMENIARYECSDDVTEQNFGRRLRHTFQNFELTPAYDIAHTLTPAQSRGQHV